MPFRTNRADLRLSDVPPFQGLISPAILLNLSKPTTLKQADGHRNRDWILAVANLAQLN